MLHLGPITIPGYGLTVACGMMLAIVLAVRCAWRLGLDSHGVWRMLIFSLVAALLGTRVEFIALHWAVVMQQPALLLYGRGISWGGVMAAAVTAVFYARSHSLPLLRTLDALVAPLLLVLAVWEGIFGAAMWSIWYTPSMLCALHLLGCIGLLIWMEGKRALPFRPGEVFGAMLYLCSLSLLGWSESAERFFPTAAPTPAGLSESIWMALLLALGGGAFWVDWTKFRGAGRTHRNSTAKEENHAF